MNLGQVQEVLGIVWSIFDQFLIKFGQICPGPGQDLAKVECPEAMGPGIGRPASLGGAWKVVPLAFGDLRRPLKAKGQPWFIGSINHDFLIYK